MGNSANRYAEQVRESIGAFNRGDTSGYAAHYAEDTRYIGPSFPEPLVGRDSIEQSAVAFSRAFPDMQWTVVTLLEDGNRVACEMHIEGTHNGPLPTSEGDVPATGRKVSFDLIEILEFNEDGFVAETRGYNDPGVLPAQLGLTSQ